MRGSQPLRPGPALDEVAAVGAGAAAAAEAALASRSRANQATASSLSVSNSKPLVEEEEALKANVVTAAGTRDRSNVSLAKEPPPNVMREVHSPA
jgi:hypothetical protein